MRGYPCKNKAVPDQHGVAPETKRISENSGEATLSPVLLGSASSREQITIDNRACLMADLDAERSGSISGWQ